MSKAIRCDRCKTCFDPWTINGEFAHIADICFQDKENYKNNEVSYRDCHYDLCPDCAKTFSKFMSGTAFVELKDYVEAERNIVSLEIENDKLNRLLKISESRNSQKLQS